ncbi:hypothetical protein [Romboutsia sp.]|uniref:hypothetical protein n=1 Tax=Romboutsia sp. TaxID=1965302 RepID=UPI003F2BD583
MVYFDGYNRNEISRITNEEDLFLGKIDKYEIEYSYTSTNPDKKVCILRDEEVYRLG